MKRALTADRGFSAGLVPIARTADRGRIWINGNDARGGGWRPCVVLAILSDVGLCEYTTTARGEPDSWTALAFIDAFRLWFEPTLSRQELAHPRGRLDRGPGHRYVRISRRPCTYKSLTKAWLEAVVAQNQGKDRLWVGMSKAGRMPQPGEILAARFPTERRA
jgi:hypothetical protein